MLSNHNYLDQSINNDVFYTYMLVHWERRKQWHLNKEYTSLWDIIFPKYYFPLKGSTDSTEISDRYQCWFRKISIEPVLYSWTRKQDNAQLHLRTCGKDTLEAENVRLCWARMHKALGLIPVPHEPDVMAHACNPSTQQVDVWGSAV